MGTLRGNFNKKESTGALFPDVSEDIDNVWQEDLLYRVLEVEIKWEKLLCNASIFIFI